MSVIDEYLATVGADSKKELEKVRQIIHEIVPEVEEVISYGVPSFKYKGKYLIGFSEYK
ncbi:DUF1801 domain-containing protein, partial [Candidatus Saccharibacteria bacterium]|nr:DUF1801 domain-containing protein [Candidatus Saccharibacteria bacterium]